MRLAAAGLILFAAQLAANEVPQSERVVTQLRSAVNVDARSGRLVRRVAPISGHAAPGGARIRPEALSRSRLERMIEDLAVRHDVDPRLVRSVVSVESNFDPLAISPRGAQGLMQLMPATARELGVANAFDPYQNVDGGIRHLKGLLEEFAGDLDLALAAYNAGKHAVYRHKSVPPFTETRDYVRKVASRYDQARRLEPGLEPVAAEGETRSVENFVDGDGRLHLVTR